MRKPYLLVNIVPLCILFCLELDYLSCVFHKVKTLMYLIRIFISLVPLLNCSPFNFIFLYTSKFMIVPLLFVLVFHFYIIQGRYAVIS